ncbi:MAG: RNA methyltransferase [Chitinophagales bacterium]
MISKSFEKYINSLKQKKYRRQYQRFIAEGEKTVQEFLSAHFPAEKILALSSWTEKNERWKKFYEVEQISEVQMSRLSTLVSPSAVLMIGMTRENKIDEKKISSQLSLALNGISDPGNLGTIIRIADWFGIENVFCSEDCADAFNPKTIQATMGSMARVKVIEKNLAELFLQFKNVSVYAATLDGKSIHEMKPSQSGFILIGNEAHGISSSLLPFIKHKITIPRIGKAESLNAAVAAGIICSWMKS